MACAEFLLSTIMITPSDSGLTPDLVFLFGFLARRIDGEAGFLGLFWAASLDTLRSSGFRGGTKNFFELPFEGFRCRTFGYNRKQRTRRTVGDLYRMLLDLLPMEVERHIQ